MKNNKEATLKEWGELLDKMGLNDVSTTKINIARILDSDASRLLNMEMNKERYNQIIDEAYNNYVKTSKPTLDGKYISQPEFIFWVKTNGEFSEKWGLKIEERELTYDEKVHEARRRFGFELEDGTRTFDINKTETIKFLQSTQRIISLTYNNETIEVYE